ncbi:hypothetical protein E3N88_00071 [Mikania micrantha]|uniref:hAT-like transposase RNase-H fold domain-containing protein n=1 Tax=Mikania micrantha TaxID=192012 RepID=A0A5N6PX16_9ASTR|nr:hypothetical protein E3N88_00071 [Mikania micrantha]
MSNDLRSWFVTFPNGMIPLVEIGGKVREGSEIVVRRPLEVRPWQCPHEGLFGRGGASDRVVEMRGSREHEGWKHKTYQAEKVKRARTQKGQRKRPKLTSKCWQHLTNSMMKKHVAACKENPANSKKDKPKLSLNKNEDGKGTLKTLKFDPKMVRKALIMMIIVDELPFSFVEREGFREFREFMEAYHKRIINFKPILSHKGEDMARYIEDCIIEWGITRVMIFTMDNATTNDLAVKELKTSLPNMLRNGMYVHVRCLAHIINLIVQDGLKAQSQVVDCIREDVIHIRASPKRLTDFKACVVDSKIKTKASLILDCKTRWNSTYDMLERAIFLEKGIELYARRDLNFRSDLANVPGYSDWLVAKSLAKLLEIFKTKTVEVSCSTYAVSHRVCAEINDISESLIELEKENNDLIDFKTMVSSMQAKYDKYFEDDHKTNKLFEFALMLDPRYKLEILQFAGVNVEDVKAEMQLLYKEYECLFATPSNNKRKYKECTSLTTSVN